MFDDSIFREVVVVSASSFKFHLKGCECVFWGCRYVDFGYLYSIFRGVCIVFLSNSIAYLELVFLVCGVCLVLVGMFNVVDTHKVSCDIFMIMMEYCVEL